MTYYVTITADRKNAKRHIASKLHNLDMAKAAALRLTSLYHVEICDSKWNVVEAYMMQPRYGVFSGRPAGTLIGYANTLGTAVRMAREYSSNQTHNYVIDMRDVDHNVSFDRYADGTMCYHIESGITPVYELSGRDRIVPIPF